MLIDYHLHTHHSSDSETKTEELIKRAIERGIADICITDHLDIFPAEGGIGSFTMEEAAKRFSRLKNELAEMQGKFPEIKIRFGIETEYCEEWMDEMRVFIDKMDFDFLIGSVHDIDGAIIASSKKEQIDSLYGNNSEEYSYGKYFDTLYKMTDWGHFSVIGHFDVFKKGGAEYYGPFNPEKYKDKIIPILQLAAKKGIGLEINTSGLRSSCREIFPHPAILKWAVEAGVEHFTTGSDAHTVKEVGQDIETAMRIAKEAGITHLSAYTKRKAEKFGI